MQITIDTEKDSPEAIQNIMYFLTDYVPDATPQDLRIAEVLRTSAGLEPLSGTYSPTLGTRHGGEPNMPPGDSRPSFSIKSPSPNPTPEEHEAWLISERAAGRGSVTSPIPPPPTSDPVPSPPVVAITVDTTEPAAELDVNGKPWDARIHATTKTKTKDGAWKYMRGLADDKRKAVEGETPAAPAPVASPAEPTPPTVSGSVTPSQIIARVAELRAKGRLEDSTLADICKICGIEGIEFVMGLDAAACVNFNAMLDESVL